jgi:hypothetical protein
MVGLLFQVKVERVKSVLDDLVSLTIIVLPSFMSERVEKAAVFRILP